MLNLTTTIAAELGNNTSANAAYNQTNFPANFSTTTVVTQGGATIPANPAIQDASLNPITPAHVSNVSIKTMIPGFTGKFYAHLTPWFRAGGGGGHIDIGINCDSVSWVTAAMQDITRRGFDGIIIDWYGSSSYQNSVTLLIQTFLTSSPTLSYSIMIDLASYANTSQLETHLAYIHSTYFSDPNYQTQGGHPVVLFFGSVSGVDYAAAKASVPSTMYWIFQGPSKLSASYADAVFDWVQPWKNGVVGGDNYNAAAALSFLNAVHGTSKGSIPVISPGFNGTLTNDVAWSLGKYLPRNNGDCWLSQAGVVNSHLPVNAIGIQVATWDDWEEGTAIETPIDTDVVIVPSVSGDTLSWAISGNSNTISGIRLLATPDGTNAAVLNNLAPGATSFNLNSISGWGSGAYTLYVIVVGKASFRAKSATIAYTKTSSPGILSAILRGHSNAGLTTGPRARFCRRIRQILGL